MSRTPENEILYKHGQLLASVANPTDSEEAVLAFFRGIASFMNFSKEFTQKVSTLFPSLKRANEYLSPVDHEILQLARREREFACELKICIERESPFQLRSYDLENGNITLERYRTDYLGDDERGGSRFEYVSEGTSVVHWTKLAEMLDGYSGIECSDIAGNLIKMAQKIKTLLNSASDFVRKSPSTGLEYYDGILELYKRLDAFLSEFRKIIESVCNQTSLREIPHFDDLLMEYNQIGKEDVIFSDGQYLVKIPHIREDLYLKKYKPLFWGNIIEQGLTCLLIEFFLYDTANSRIRKCEECDYFYAPKYNRKTISCSESCRLKHHNRERIKSGKHRDYKRDKRRRGAKISYYG